jgi:nickel/cobalt exporter
MTKFSWLIIDIVIQTPHGTLTLSVFEDDVPPEFRIKYSDFVVLPAVGDIEVETVRSDGSRETFHFVPLSVEDPSFLHSTDEIPEPHEFTATVRYSLNGEMFTRSLEFAEPEGHHHGHHHQNDPEKMDKAPIMYI